MSYNIFTLGVLSVAVVGYQFKPSGRGSTWVQPTAFVLGIALAESQYGGCECPLLSKPLAKQTKTRTFTTKKPIVM